MANKPTTKSDSKVTTTKTTAKPFPTGTATGAAVGKKGNDIPKSSLTSAVTSDRSATLVTVATEHVETDPMVKAGLGLIKVEGIDFRYVGISPAHDKDAATPSGYPITLDNSTFTPLSDVPFDRSIRVKDPKSCEYYYPADGCMNWAMCELGGNKLF